MKKRVIRVSLALFALAITNNVGAQVDPEIVNWYNGKLGMNTEKAYKKLKKKKSETVIVAVVDSGIDIEHEDLVGKIWTNADEIPGNGIDDDNNGYIDDVHGWNFLGSKSGEHQDNARLEKTRILAKLSKKYDGIDESTVSSADKEEFALYQKVKQEVETERAEYEAYLPQLEMLPAIMKQIPTMIETQLGNADYTVEDLKAWEPTDPQMAQLKGLAIAMKKGDFTEETVKKQKEQIESMLNYNLNVDYDDRSLIGDNVDDFSDVHYGNNDVEGPDALHGTHVGGIIGAIRGNDKGGDGVAENVQLMVLRAVPNGDEFDKDIALAIRYAVDNGAQVINMSFGKAYSPHAKEVYEAFKYADSKGVLLVHAAGNDHKDIDTEPNFPTYKYSFQPERLDHFLTIGASTRFAKPTKEDKKEGIDYGSLAASFSNYGQVGVDVFAPGFEIWNTVPQSDYMKLQGTSMAAPMVSGVAAMLKSYFPTLTMSEIKNIMLTTATPYKGSMQQMPGEEKAVDFGTLSTTGGVVNVLAAVKACKKLEKSKQ